MSDIAAQGNRTDGERQALEVAEEAREAEWNHPSFCAELFAGKFRFDYIFPFPEQSLQDKVIGDELIKKTLDYLIKNHDPEKTDRTREIPDQVLQVDSFHSKECLGIWLFDLQT